MRGRFAGRGGNTAPFDLAIPENSNPPLIVGAAKGFNSTGSKLSDAVREIEELANVRLPRQFVFAFIDGIGWKRREADLRRIYNLWESQYIDGIYTLVHLERFKEDLRNAAVRHELL
jgi:DpnII restriction endonuclease